MTKDLQPIGVFDSGVGGLTVLRHLVSVMPHETFVYLGDLARVPYGNKSPETVKTYAQECASFLLHHNVRMIVVACNTVSATALEMLTASVSVPVVGMIEPAATAAIRATRNGKIGVIGTRATISSDAYAAAIKRSAPEIEVFSCACPLFVPLVEEGWFTANATMLVAEEYLQPLRNSGVDTVVLGCTHYPLLADVLRTVLPGVTLIDCGESAAQVAVDMLRGSADIADSNGSVSLYVTDHTPMFTTLASHILGRTIEDPVRVSLETRREIS